MLARELQKVVAEERSARETIDTGAESVRREWNQYQTMAERRERELSNTVESLRRKLKREKESATPLLSTLQDEMASMKQQHSIALLKVRHLSSSAFYQSKGYLERKFYFGIKRRDSGTMFAATAQ